MADLDRWGEAVGRGLGWPPGTFFAAYHANRQSVCAEALEQVPVAAALTAMLAARHHALECTPGQLLEELGHYRPDHASPATGWPKSPSALSTTLRRLAAQLREIGIVVVFGRRHDGRIIRFEKAGAETRTTPAGTMSQAAWRTTPPRDAPGYCVRPHGAPALPDLPGKPAGRCER